MSKEAQPTKEKRHWYELYLFGHYVHPAIVLVVGYVVENVFSFSLFKAFGGIMMLAGLVGLAMKYVFKR